MLFDLVLMDYFHHYLARFAGVLMVVMRVKSFSRSGKVEGGVEANDGSIAKSFLAEKNNRKQS